MGLMDKFKNLFTEEVEEEVVEEPIKKEVIQVEIPSPRRSVEDVYEPEEEKPVKNDGYQFPFFDDDDFSSLEVSDKPVRESKKKSSYRKESYKKESNEVYSPSKEEKKVFKPTPIISPVYGILDKNYQKEDIRTKSEKPRTYYNAKEAAVDEIRNKAYGTLEDDIETTLFGRNRALFDDKQEDEVVDCSKADESVMKMIDNDNEIMSDDIIGEKPRHVSDDFDMEITDLIEEELGREESPAPRKISDKELFSMIDSMYPKGDE